MGAWIICSNICAWEQISFTIRLYEEQGLGHGHPKSPIEPPSVYIENDTLMFEAYHPDYVLNIKDEDGEIVYTTTVYSSVTQVVLPADLSGDYVIELVMSNWIFTGCITL